MGISQRLIALRRERDLTQQEMADRVGLHVNQIRRYEAEQAHPSLTLRSAFGRIMNNQKM